MTKSDSIKWEKKDYEMRRNMINWYKEIFLNVEQDEYFQLLDVSKGFTSLGNTGAVEKLEGRFYSHHFQYTISASTQYLGCVAIYRGEYLRKPKSRSGFLIEGEFSRKTWERIKDAIILQELVKLKDGLEMIESGKLEVDE